MGYGAEVILHGDTYDDAVAEASRICDERNAVFIHSFDNPDVIAGQGTIGLGNTGLIGKGGGGGSGSGYGRGAGAGFGGQGKRVPKVRQAKAQVKGALDKDIIRRIVRAHINEVRSCYNATLTKDPNASGSIAIKFLIDAHGKVMVAKVQSNDTGYDDLGKCIAKKVERWKFPKPKGSTVEVVYPFKLTPG